MLQRVLGLLQVCPLTWMTRQPAFWRSSTSSRSASASWYAWALRLRSLRGNDQFRMVTGPAQVQINELNR